MLKHSKIGNLAAKEPKYKFEPAKPAKADDKKVTDFYHGCYMLDPLMECVRDEYYRRLSGRQV